MELNIEIYPAKEDALTILNVIEDKLRALQKINAIASYTLSIKVDLTETYTILSQELEEAQEIEIVE